ncbi:MAG TPA: cytochrome c maturation protein CcmE [Acidimicrobiia bacterium]|nr:cytochrome c maturation protein CcmE [Acidimicrobiia bacterium]
MPYKSFVLPAIGVVVLVLGFMLFGGLGDNLVYYLTPAEAVTQRTDFPDGERFRLGGLVVDGTVQETDKGVTFVVTDGDKSIDVVNTGAPPQLFREGIGVVVEGAWSGDHFESDTLIVKHDEEYRSEEDGAYVPPTGG